LRELILSGATQKAGLKKDWEQFKKGLVLSFHTKSQQIQKVIEYISPPDVCADDDPSISFTAATLRKNKLYVPTHTEILVYDLNTYQLEKYFTYPSLNDVHHVYPRNNGNLLICNTGLDMVIETSPKGVILNEWNVGRGGPWKAFDPLIDYRKVPTTKPHKHHPNFVFELEDEIWVTRCLQKDAICLTDPWKEITIGRQLIHDGVLYKNHLYFTQVDGHIIKVNAGSLQVVQDIDLTTVGSHEEKLGWCRGIKPLTEDIILVGFTRIRPSSRVNEDGSREYYGQHGFLPTRIACYNIKEMALMWEKDLEPHGMNAIYSIS